MNMMCLSLDFIRVEAGCGVEVATGVDGRGSGERFMYGSSVHLCGSESFVKGRRCEIRHTPGCDVVRSIRLFSIQYEREQRDMVQVYQMGSLEYVQQHLYKMANPHLPSCDEKPYRLESYIVPLGDPA